MFKLRAKDPFRVLFVGESWIKHTVHLKGFDQFHTTEYEEGAGIFLRCLAEQGFDVTYLRCHEISRKFPTSVEDLSNFDVVVLSDVGSNSFLLTEDVFLRSRRQENLLSLIKTYVSLGGGLVMVGGYMSFTGIDARARYAMSPLADVLPVSMLPHDDRIEVPEGVVANVLVETHPCLGTANRDWPELLGYNRVFAKQGSTVVTSVNDDPLLVVGEFGNGRSAVFTSDLAPHWAPPDFLSWTHYSSLWSSILRWAGGRG